MKTIIIAPGYIDNDIALKQLTGIDATEVLVCSISGLGKLGAQYAKENNLKCTEYGPNWKKDFHRAIEKRNELIVSKCDSVVVVWDGLSRVIVKLILEAKKQNKPVNEINMV